MRETQKLGAKTVYNNTPQNKQEIAKNKQIMKIVKCLKQFYFSLSVFSLPQRKGKKESDFFSSLLYSWNPSCLDFLLALCLIRKTRWPPSPTGNKGVHTQFLHSSPTPAVFPLSFLSFFLTVLKSSQMSNYLGKKVIEEQRSTRPLVSFREDMRSYCRARRVFPLQSLRTGGSHVLWADLCLWALRWQRSCSHAGEAVGRERECLSIHSPLQRETSTTRLSLTRSRGRSGSEPNFQTSQCSVSQPLLRLNDQFTVLCLKVSLLVKSGTQEVKLYFAAATDLVSCTSFIILLSIHINSIKVRIHLKWLL